MPTLYLIPCPLGLTPLDHVLPEETRRIAAGLATFVVENAKSARAFLKQVGTALPLQQLTLLELNEHTRANEMAALLAPLLAGEDVGVISEAGCPAIADPGAELARLAHQHGIRVRPLVGPSSILLALMGSGLVGQRFAFHGYLPAKPEERVQALRELEARSRREDAAQAFIETPYRNDALFDALVATCHENTLLTLACDLTLGSETLVTRRVSDWRKSRPEIHRRPCVFLLQALGGGGRNK
ncbi:MAG: SAM-dependent methyltransferase [Betaproteobacteria bacterium]|nr:SAM-dependent methyltransferase [Betaproteobacteria bacterium]